jgi:hypothetical protein
VIIAVFGALGWFLTHKDSGAEVTPVSQATATSTPSPQETVDGLSRQQFIDKAKDLGLTQKEAEAGFESQGIKEEANRLKDLLKKGQDAIEVCGAGSPSGVYDGCTGQVNDPELTVSDVTGYGYKIVATNGKVWFTYVKLPQGGDNRSCAPANQYGCGLSGEW